MKEEDVIKGLFDKADMDYPEVDLEDANMHKIKKRAYYQKQKQRYLLLGRLSLGVFVLLCLLYLFAVSAQNLQGLTGGGYVWIGVPVLLLIGLIQLELMGNGKDAQGTGG